MCYKAPGPRCASHAGADLAAANEAYAINPSPKNHEARDEAQKDYNTTATGIKELRAAGAHEDADKFEAIRKDKIKAYKKSLTPLSGLDRFDPNAWDRVSPQSRANAAAYTNDFRELNCIMTAASRSTPVDEKAMIAVIANPETKPGTISEYAGSYASEAVQKKIRERLEAPIYQAHFKRLRDQLDDPKTSEAEIRKAEGVLTAFPLANPVDARIALGKAIKHPNCPADLVEKYSNAEYSMHRNAVAMNPNVPQETIDRLLTDEDPYVRRTVLGQSKISHDQKMNALRYEESEIVLGHYKQYYEENGGEEYFEEWY